jgi:hypothetical protein
MSSWTAGAPGPSVWAGSGSYSTSISSRTPPRHSSLSATGGHRLADEPGASPGEQGDCGRGLGVQRHRERTGRARDRRRDHVRDAGTLAGACGSHAMDARMGVQAAQEDDMQHAGQG